MHSSHLHTNNTTMSSSYVVLHNISMISTLYHSSLLSRSSLNQTARYFWGSRAIVHNWAIVKPEKLLMTRTLLITCVDLPAFVPPSKKSDCLQRSSQGFHGTINIVHTLLSCLKERILASLKTWQVTSVRNASMSNMTMLDVVALSDNPFFQHFSPDVSYRRSMCLNMNAANRLRKTEISGTSLKRVPDCQDNFSPPSADWRVPDYQDNFSPPSADWRVPDYQDNFSPPSSTDLTKKQLVMKFEIKTIPINDVLLFCL